jgi:Predicted ATPase with chaperone activity
MAYGVVHSRAALGVDAPAVRVEVRLAGGLPTFQVAGAQEGALRDLRDRVQSALSALGLPFPQGRVTVNLAPADLPKRGARFDLPVALALLRAQGQLAPEPLQGSEFLGELYLDGTLGPLPGALAAVAASARARGTLILPSGNAVEANSLPGGSRAPSIFPGRRAGLVHCS